MQASRLTPIALALLQLFPGAAHGAAGMPPLAVDPALLAPAPSPAPAAQAPARKPAETAPPAASETPHAGGPRTQEQAAPPAAPKPLAKPAAADGQAPILIRADRIQGRENQEVQASGKVELHQDGQSLYADHLTYFEPEDKVVAKGDVRIIQTGTLLQGPDLELKLDTNIGHMDRPSYELTETHARGKGSKLLFRGKEQYRLLDANYTTCPIGQDDWFFHVSQLDIDRTAQVGTARNAYLDFMGVPLLYTPWISFPLNNQRKSGFLAPSFGTTGNSGSEFALPYYWNIAPNYDATITPRVFTKRGLQLNNEFRYLEPDYGGVLEADVLPDDRVKGENRFLLFLQHQQNLGSNWHASLNLQKVSDNSYFTDLSTEVSAVSQTILPREGTLSYTGGGWWNFLARVQRFQTLQDPLAPITPPYDRAPQFLVTANKEVPLGAEAAFSGEFVNFVHPTLVNGRRLALHPTLDLPLRNRWGYVTPKLGLHYVRYNLDPNTTSLTNASLTVPTFSLDSGVTFERDLALGGHDFTQTLEPRAYYVYIPYRDQSRLPIFDTALADLNFAQLFSENQFTGSDRVNDANQLTLAVTSRLIDAGTGAERLRGAIGQRYYFKDQQVGLPGVPLRTDNSSDVLATLGGQVTPALALDGGWQYSPELNASQQLNFAAHYRPAAGRVVNFIYRYTRDSLKQVDISSQWPLSGRISGLARWNYSLLDRRLLEGLAGLEYNGGCWVLRGVVHSLVTATAQTTNAFFLQLELNGVGRVGANPLDVLRQNISGYTKTND